MACHLIDPDARQDVLAAAQRLKMARSAHVYVRGNTADFYDWLRHLKRGHLPEGPPVWICGDCHVGNLGPLAHSDGRVEIQIRDLDQTVIGNPIHDLVRLGLSLASGARGSDLPGVTTARILEQIIEGYAGAMEPSQTGEEGDDFPEAMRVAVKTARRRSWHHLAKERIENIKPTIPLGKRFWPLATDERSEITRLFEKDHVRQLATMQRSRKDNAPVDMLDAKKRMQFARETSLLCAARRRRQAVGALSDGPEPCKLPRRRMIPRTCLKTRHNGLWRARVICHRIWENGRAPFNCSAARFLSVSFSRRI